MKKCGFVKKLAASVLAAALAVSACTITAFAGIPARYEFGYVDVGVEVTDVQEDNVFDIDTDYKINFCVLVHDGRMAVWTKYKGFTNLKSKALEFAVKNHFTHETGIDASCYDWVYIGNQIGEFKLSELGEGWGNVRIEDTWVTRNNGDAESANLNVETLGGFGVEYLCYGYYMPDLAVDYNNVGLNED